MKTIIIVNKLAGKGKAFKVYQSIKDIVENVDSIKIFFTNHPGELGKICSEFKNEKCKIIIMGGDGTVNSVINGLGIKSNCSVAVAPIGSGNDFAKEFSWYHDKNYRNMLERIIASEEYSKCDVGEIRYVSHENKNFNHLFLSSCGIGFDALVSAMSRKINYLRGLPLYLAAVVKSLTKYKAVDVISASHETNLIGSKLMVSIGNTKYAGGGFMLNPAAKIDDGILNACIPHYLKISKILQVLPKAIHGSHINLPEVKMLNFEKIAFEFGAPQYLHADGEVISESVSGCEIICHPNALTLVR